MKKAIPSCNTNRGNSALTHASISSNTKLLLSGLQKAVEFVCDVLYKDIMHCRLVDEWVSVVLQA